MCDLFPDPPVCRPRAGGSLQNGQSLSSHPKGLIRGGDDICAAESLLHFSKSTRKARGGGGKLPCGCCVDSGTGSSRCSCPSDQTWLCPQGRHPGRGGWGSLRVQAEDSGWCASHLFFLLIWVFVASHGFFLVAGSRGCSLLRFPLWSTGSRPMGVSTYSMRALDLSLEGSQIPYSVGVAHGLSHCGMWVHWGLGFKPLSPALAGGSLSTAPPGRPALRFQCICCSALSEIGPLSDSPHSWPWNPSQ